MVFQDLHLVFLICVLALLSFLGLYRLTSTSRKVTSSTPQRQAHRHFKYKPLKGLAEFRLLQLSPGKGSQPIVCRLRHFNFSYVHIHASESGHASSSDWASFQTFPQYQALSYVWGAPEAGHTILCNGKIFRVTTSLKNALCQVRDPRKKIYIWADAICINQSDLRERKQQVDLMRVIYAQAEVVSICLGEMNCPVENLHVLRAIFRPNTTARSDAVPAETDRLPSNSALTPSPFRHLSWWRPQRSEQRPRVAMTTSTVSRKMLQRLVPSSWEVLANFFDNPWFKRIWVVQEVAEGRKAHVLLGNLEIPWENIVDLATKLQRDSVCRAAICQFAKTKGFQNVLFMNNQVSVPSHDPIPILLQLARDFDASDPRDKVYAMLHRPIRKPRAYMDLHFGRDREYLEFFAQSMCLLHFWLMALGYPLTDMRFWYFLAALGTTAYYMKYFNSMCLVTFDFYQRLVNFGYKLDRIVFSSLQLTDTIFNMLSIRADYSLTVSTVYRLVAMRLIERTHKLNILSYVNHGTTIDTTYPSWVPRWDVPTGGIEILTALPGHEYQACCELEHTLPVSPQYADHLIVEGIRFSTISSMVSEVITSTEFAHLRASLPFLAINRTVTFNGLGFDAHKSNESLFRAQFATLTAGRLGYMERNRTGYGLGELQRRVAAALRASFGRRQFVTEDGRLGIGPAAIQSGDIVCVLFGGCVPYILRPTDTDGVYKMVGESYVHGVMRGEVVKMWRAGRFSKAKFTLC